MCECLEVKAHPIPHINPLPPFYPHTAFTRKQDRLWPKLAVGMPLAAKAARRKDAPHSHIITN